MGKKVIITGNAAAAHASYALSEIAVIFPITPATEMGKMTNTWANQGLKNIFNTKIDVVRMQSEAGVAGAVHGSLSAGSLATTYTSSQGLLLMIPTMYRIAGDMLPAVFHVATRSLASQSLSIFGDHSDVMSCKNTGFAMMSSSLVQEVMDLSVISHLATLKAQIPFLSFFDGFRTSHEIQKIEEISFDTISELFEYQYLERFRNRALRPEKPFAKVAAQNQDIYFQGRETVNKYYEKVPEIVQEYMDKLAVKVGRQYHIFDYVGTPDAEKIIIAMGSACETITETVNYLASRGEKVGAVKVRLYRPFSIESFINALPVTVKKIAVLDRTKEPGAIGEPLYMDVATALAGQNIKVIGGRYGLAGKDFSPSDVKAVYDHLDSKCFHGFTIGINDDVSNLSIPVNDIVNIGNEDTLNCIFWGLSSDGTIGASKKTVRIIGENTDMNVQGYFVHSAKKFNNVTVSHLRFSKEKIEKPYLITQPDFVACHNPAYIGRYDMLNRIREGGTFLLNSGYNSSEVFDHLTKEMQETIITKNIKFYNINASKIADGSGLGTHINTVMMTAFFKISAIFSDEEAIRLIKISIKEEYENKGGKIVEMNLNCVDKVYASLEYIKTPSSITKSFTPPALIPDKVSDFAKGIIDPILHFKGDDIPVSRLPFDGILPTATSKFEKHALGGTRIPKWQPEYCNQCNQCVNACPNAVIRAKQIDQENLKNAPVGFSTLKSNTRNNKDLAYRIQVYVDYCTGCGVCVETCPVKPKALKFSTLKKEHETGEVENYLFFENLPENVLNGISETTLKGAMFKQPLFEFPSVCAGCGETPYIKIITQLYGNRMIIANATGCSSIYGGSFPTVPYCQNKKGHGPAWSTSLIENNAEYGLGISLAVNSNRRQLRMNVEKLLSCNIENKELTASLNNCMELWNDVSQKAIDAQEKAKEQIETALRQSNTGTIRTMLERIHELQDYFVKKSIWIIGGDGWANDIGYSGLDHVVASGRNINILVLDTEVFSNTGGQASKASNIASTAEFANTGKRRPKKNLAFMCMIYGDAYVASISLGANRKQALAAFQEAEAYNGTSIILAYSPCIAHGIDMGKSQVREKQAVECGYWPLFRYNPALKRPFTWDTEKPAGNFKEFLKGERSYIALEKADHKAAETLYALAKTNALKQLKFFKKMGSIIGRFLSD